jgi:alpha-1,6-mannosyltransferase
MLVPACYLAWRYPLMRHASGLTDLGKLSAYSRVTFGLFVGAIALQFAAYILALRETRRVSPRRALPVLWVCGGATALCMSAMYPVSAIDIYIYAAHSRLFTTYGVNPSAAFPRDYPSDPWTRLASRQWGQYESPYGPLWNLLAAPVMANADTSITFALVGFKLLALASLLLGTWAVMRAWQAVSPQDAATGALFFLWNPLVLWEGIGNGHNDLVMMAPLLLAFWAYNQRRDGLVVPLIVSAVFVKYVPVVLLPLAALAVWRRAPSMAARLRVAIWSIALSLVVVAVAMYPFYDLAAIRTSIAHHSVLYRLSPAAAGMALFRGRMTSGEYKYWVQLGGMAIVLLVLAWQGWRVWRNSRLLASAALTLMVVFLIVARPNFAAWYLIWPVGLAALVPWGWSGWYTIMWSATGLASYALSYWIAAWQHLRFERAQLFSVLLCFGIPILLGAGRLVQSLYANMRKRSADARRNRVRTVLGDQKGAG